MRKLALELDELSVESFPTTAEEPRAQGTVHGAAALFATREPYCTRGETCRTSCAGAPLCTCPIL